MFTLLYLGILLLVASIGVTAKPIAVHQLLVVNTSNHVIVRLKSIDVNTNNIKYTIKSNAVTGEMYQLSKVYSDFGYNPIFGVPLSSSNVVTGSANRFIYNRPQYDVAKNAKWDTIQFTANDGTDSEVGLITFVPPSGAFIGSDFLLNNEDWQIVGNKAVVPASFENFNRGAQLSNYILGKDDLINLDRNSKKDNSLWFFQAPAKFLGNFGLAYGGVISFVMTSFSGNFNNLNANNLPLIKMECATCIGPVSQGITLIYPINAPNTIKYNGETRRFEIPLIEGKGWLKDPQNTLLSYTAASRCDVIQVISRLTKFQILGDWTTGEETVAIDDVMIKNTKAQLPVCAMSKTDASICTC